ncbi:unnamed protein product [Ectocarpus sp. 12 AP-2014]
MAFRCLLARGRHLSTSFLSWRQSTRRHTTSSAASAAAAAVAQPSVPRSRTPVFPGGLLLLTAMVVSWERESGEVQCDSATDEEVMGAAASMSSEKRELRRVALAHLTKSVRTGAVNDSLNNRSQDSTVGVYEEGGGVGGTVALAAALLRPGEREDEEASQSDGGEGDTVPLPPNVHDVDKILVKTPLLRDDNAFHDTLNNDNGISCPFVLNRPDQDGEGIEAVVRFGKSIAGHPKIVHGGVTALTFDNLFGMALFLQNTGAVFTAYIKVDFKAPLPCLTTAVVDITVDRKEGRKLYVTGRLKSLDGTVTFSSAEALFVKPKEASSAGGEGRDGEPSDLLRGLVV